MRSIRAIAAAMVAGCISCWGTSLLAQAIEGSSNPAKHATPSIPTLAASLRSGIGLRAGDLGFDPVADLNGDGITNALDVAMFRLGRTTATVASASRAEAGRPQKGRGTINALTGERVIVVG